jgi:hypothetical protein
VAGYVYDEHVGRFIPASIDVLTLDGDKIAAVTAFVFGEDSTDPAGKYASFALPPGIP